MSTHPESAAPSKPLSSKASQSSSSLSCGFASRGHAQRQSRYELSLSCGGQSSAVGPASGGSGRHGVKQALHDGLLRGNPGRLSSRPSRYLPIEWARNS